MSEGTAPTFYMSVNIKQVVPTSQQQQLAAESLYRDANTLLYADNKPSEDAIDRVIGKINRERVTLLTFLAQILTISQY